MTKVALVGYGYWGPNLARSLSEIPGVEVSYIVDQSEANLNKAKARFPQARTLPDISPALEDKEVAGVVISTPAETHYELAKRCLEAKKDILVEKPLALSYAEGKKLLHMTRQTDRILMVGHLMLYHPTVEYMKNLLKKGEIGKPRYFFSQRLNLGRVRTDENAMWSLAPHDISVLLYFLDETPESICAHGGCFLQDNIEDIVLIHLRFPSGTIADIQVSWLAPHKIRRITLVGEKKMLVFDDVEPFEKLKVYEWTIAPSHGPSISNFAPRYGPIYAPYIPSKEPLKAECEEFIRCIKTRERPRTDVEEGLKVLKVLECAQRSLESKRAVEPNTLT